MASNTEGKRQILKQKLDARADQIRMEYKAKMQELEDECAIK